MRVCFSAPYAYPLFDPANAAPIGGAETRAWLLARGLTRLAVSADVLVESSPAFEARTFDGVRVWNLSDGYDRMRHRVADWWSPAEGSAPRWRSQLLWELPCLACVKIWSRMFPRPTLEALLSRIDPDVCCVFGVSRRSLRIVDAAQRQGRTAVLCIASNDDLHAQFVSGSSYRTPHGESGDECARLLATADVVITQSALQQSLLRQRFGRDGHLLPAPFDFIGWRAAQSRSSPTLRRLGLDRYVLWVGRADRFHKRPLLAMELAAQCPEVPFLFLVNGGDASVAAELRARATANVRLIDQVPFEQMPAVLSGARRRW